MNVVSEMKRKKKRNELVIYKVRKKHICTPDHKYLIYRMRDDFDVWKSNKICANIYKNKIADVVICFFFSRFYVFRSEWIGNLNE